MARNINNLFITATVFLCVVVLLITGITFPKFIASQNVKLRTVFNSSVNSLKFSSKEYRISNRTGIESSRSTSIYANKDEETEKSSISNFLPSKAFESLQTPPEVKRIKRQTPSQQISEDVFAWNFSLDVSRLRSTNINEATKNNSATPAVKHLGVVLYAESQEPQEAAFSDLQRALGSVGAFIKNIFNSGSRNGIHDLKDMNEMKIEQSATESPSERSEIVSATQDISVIGNVEQSRNTVEKQIVQSFNEPSETSVLEASKNPDSENFENRNKSFIQRGRDGRIFFRFFEFGGKLLGKTTPVSVAEETENSVLGTQAVENIFRGDESLHDNVRQQKSEFVTENLRQKPSIHSDSLKYETDHPGKDLIEAYNTEELGLQPTIQQHECSDCVTGDMELLVIPHKKEESDETKDGTLFTDEILENFCNSPSKGLEESQPILLEEKTSETDVAIEDSFLISSNELTTESIMLPNKERRFFSLFDSGSGRSAITSNENDLVSEEQIGGFKNFPSVLDCEIFFRRKQKISPKPNGLDTSTFKSTFISNFEISTLAPELEMQQKQFSTDLNSFVQTVGEISENKITESVESADLTLHKGLFIAKNEEITTESKNFVVTDKLNTLENIHTDNTVVKITDEQREVRFLGFLGFGSGNDAQDRNMSNSGWFLSGFFGSGARSLDEPEKAELGSGESFHGDFSKDERMLVSERDGLEDSSTTSDQENLLNFLGFTGSGNGRELTERSELIVTELGGHIDNGCGINCSSNTEEFRECDDYECDFETSQNTENADGTEPLNPIPLNEDDCHDNCYPSTEFFNKNSNLTNELISHDSGNLTEYFHEHLESCNCSHENNFTGEIGISPECDDCYSNVPELSDVTRMGSVSLLTETALLDQNLSELNDENEDDCNDTNHENNLHFEKQIPETSTGLVTMDHQINSNVSVTDLENESSVISFGLDIEKGSRYPEYTTDIVQPLNITENPQERQTTEMKPRRLMGTIFLTGSGDGGLFGDDGGPINLVEEASTNNPVVFSRRKGRLDDLPIDPCDDCGDLSDLLEVVNPSIESSDNAVVSPVNTFKSEETLKTSLTEIENITFTSVTNKPASVPGFIPVEPQPRSCAGARDCNITLGERCITINSSPVCDCGRTFVRQKETRMCVPKGHVEATLKLPAEIFDSDLKDPESARYKQMSQKSVDTMWLLLSETPEILRLVSDVKLAKFTAGSLIISLDLSLAVKKELEAETIKTLEDKLQKALGDENLIKRAALDMRNASVLSITSEIDPCKSTVLNYCSKNAYCTWSEAHPGRHSCICKEHYLDVSSDPLYPGETCIDQCPPNYCGSNGHCEILKDKERHCLCNGLYFGERCEIPGMVVICSLSVAAFISLAVLCIVVLKIRCKKRSYGRTPTFRRSEDVAPHTFAGGRMSDAIALGERGAQISKFLSLSTPMHNPPVIRVTRPTLNESSISFDYDASFDVTPSLEEQTPENGKSNV